MGIDTLEITTCKSQESIIVLPHFIVAKCSKMDGRFLSNMKGLPFAVSYSLDPFCQPDLDLKCYQQMTLAGKEFKSFLPCGDFHLLITFANTVGHDLDPNQI